MPCWEAQFWVNVCHARRVLAEGRLVGEDGVAVLIAELFAFQIEPAGVDGGLETPGVEGKREVMAHPGNVVLFAGFSQQRIGGGAIRAFHIFEFDDGNPRAGGRLKGSGVVNLGGRGRAKLGVCGRRHNGAQGYYGEGVEDASARCASEDVKHDDWTAPSFSL